MSLTIAVSSLKGGVGKSTIALNLATCLHRAGHRALVVDADPQGTCRTWAAKAAEVEHDGPPVVGIEGRTLRRDLDRVAKGFDVAIIDSPPRMGIEARAAMLAADLVVMPVIPGAADVWALQETVAVLEDARQLRPELRAYVVLNRSDRTTLAKLAHRALADLAVEMLEASLGNRVAFGEATLAGMGVVDYAPQSEAAFDVRRMTKAILTAIEGKPS
jgi:chromosome partitioning protein